MPFALDSSPEISELSEAVNYLLANFGPNVVADPVSGKITGPTGDTIAYLYKYMAVKYADSADGSVNFSNSPINRTYYGLRNSNDASESNNPADYIWYKVSGGFGLTKLLWYQTTGGRQIQFAASVSAPDSGWLSDTGASIDLDIITSGTIPVIAETFNSYFTPTILQVPRSGSPLTPTFTGIVPVMYATDKGVVIPFTDAQTDTAVSFVNNTWRIGNSSTTGYGDISYTNITIGNPTDAGDFAQWPNPTAMSGNPAYITVPVRYKNSLGVVSQASVATLQLVFVDPGAQGTQGSSVDISGYSSFTQNAGGAFTPPSATLSALIQNITSPTYSWAISGATPTSSTASSVVVTPTSSSIGVTVTLTVNGSNLSSPISKTINMPVVYDGAPGTAGANGVMSAFPTIYIWTGSSAVPTRPTTTSTYTWATGAYTAPSGWSTSAPSNTTAGNYLWAITVPLTVTATTTTSTLDWTNTSYPIKSIAYNGANGANGTNGTNGTNGSATFVVTRSANDGSPPTNAEVNAVIGRDPIAGDIVTVSYNAANNAVVYRYTTSWVSQATYITGSLIVSNTITADKLSVTQLSSIVSSTGTLIINSGGYLRGGQTDYNVGTGFFLGYSGTTYKFSLGSVKTGAVNVTTDVITLAAHGYSNNQQIIFTGIGSMTNVTANKIYYVVNATSSTFQISTTYAGSAYNITGANSSVSFTSQSISWDGSALNITGNLFGGTIGIGVGGTTNGYGFEVNSAGVVRSDNIFCASGYFINATTATTSPVTSTSYSPNEAIVGAIAATNTSSLAHGVRGINYYKGNSGLVGAANNYDFYADGSGLNYGPFTGNHDLLVPVGETLTPGDMVVDVQCIARKDWSNAVFQVTKSTQANQSGCRGIFIGELVPLSQVQPAVFIESFVEVDGQTVPIMTAQYEAIKDQYLFGSMSALGEGSIQVCGQNGNISMDTLIVTSDMPGIGMAQSDDVIRSITVAKSRESVVFDSPNQVKTIACIYLGG